MVNIRRSLYGQIGPIADRQVSKCPRKLANGHENHPSHQWMMASMPWTGRLEPLFSFGRPGVNFEQATVRLLVG